MAHHNEGAIALVEDDSHKRATLAFPEDQDHDEQIPKSKKIIRKCLTFLFSHIGLTALVIGYTIGGAFLFKGIEEGKWLDQKEADLDARRPALAAEPDYLVYAATSVSVWRASWMDDKVLRFWNGTHQINEIYPDDWSRNTVEQIHLWEVELNRYIINSVARMAAEFAANRTAREMEHATNVRDAPNWSFPSAFLYALSIVTTIGYGHVAPYTNFGKVATILYAIIGIPVMLAFLANIGNLLARVFRMLFDQLFLMKQCRKVYRRRSRAQSLASGPSSAVNSPGPVRAAKSSVSSAASSPVLSRLQKPGTSSMSSSPSVIVKSGAGKPARPAASYSPVPARLQQYRDAKPTIVLQDATNAPEVRSMSLQPYEYTTAQMEEIADVEKAKKSVPVLMCVVIMGVYLFGGAVLFSVWEGWNYLEGLYFCFITLSTIGLGDMIPGASLLNLAGGKGQMIACCLYILIGLALLASCFNLIHDSARGGFKMIGEKIGLVKQKPTSRRQSTATIV